MVAELSHRRFGLPKFSCLILCAPNTYRSFEAPDGNSWLPVCPHPNRTFRLLMCSLSCINASLETFQANASEGKFARSEEHTSELQSLMRSSYAVFCLKKKNKQELHT